MTERERAAALLLVRHLERLEATQEVLGRHLVSGWGAHLVPEEPTHDELVAGARLIRTIVERELLPAPRTGEAD